MYYFKTLFCESDQSFNHGDETKPMEKGNYSIMEMMAGSHTTLGCKLIQTEMPGWAELVRAPIQDLWGNLRRCLRKWQWQRCRWQSLLLSHNWVNNLCDGRELGFLEKLWAWHETMVLSIRLYLKTTIDFQWKVELITWGTNHISVSSFLT